MLESSKITVKKTFGREAFPVLSHKFKTTNFVTNEFDSPGRLARCGHAPANAI